MVVLIVEPDPSEQQRLSSCIQSQGHLSMTTDTAQSALRIARREQLGLVLLAANGHPGQTNGFLQAARELQYPLRVIVLSRRASLEDATAAMKEGAHDFWIKPVDRDRLIKTLELLDSRAEPNKRAASSDSWEIITRNATMASLKTLAKRVAASRATAFLQGESGTGKELLARYIHNHSERRDHPFVALNCAALPETLMESELFGHEKGAFTGAIKTKEGKFELAHQGTLFLDEVTEIPLHLQPKLLRVLQEGEVDRIGGKHPISIDVRVIAATNRTVEEAVAAGQFRKDLYYRLNVIPLRIPPLRERREDIPLLCEFFLRKYAAIHNCVVEAITPDALKTLQNHPWPGNVRELENVVQRAMLFTEDHTIETEHLVFDRSATPMPGSDLELMSIDEMERLLIHKALSTCTGNRTRAAELLGISVRTLRNKLHQYGEA